MDTTPEPTELLSTSEPDSTPVHVPPPGGEAQRFAHFGMGGELFAITLVNLVLKVLTLGIYHFWGKTRVRRYVWSHTHFAGEPFEYTGRGLELFIGYVIATLVLAPVIGGFQFLPLLAPDRPVLMFALMAVIYVALLFLIGFAMYSSRRYLLSRTRWRSIRFGLSGSAVRFGLKTLQYTLLTIITLGLYFPFMRNHQTALFINTMWFGDRHLTYDGRGKDLFKRFLGLWGIYLLLLGAFIGGTVGMAILGTQIGEAGTPPDPTLIIGLGVLFWVGAGLGWLWYQVGEYRYFINHTRLNEIRLNLNAGTGSLIKLALGNMLLMLVTLGFAYAWVVVRTARFLTAHLQLEGALNLDAIAQNPEGIPRMGEGLAESFDLGSGI